MALTAAQHEIMSKRLRPVAVWMIGTLLVQILVGMAISVFGTWLPIDAIRVKDKQWTIVSLIGLVAIIAAFGGGSAFVSTGGTNELSSFIMAFTCVIALAVYLFPFLRKGRQN